MSNPVSLPEPDIWRLYQLMLYSRLYEEQVKRIWDEGSIPGEMHLSMGEEGIVVGIVDHLQEGDSMALDHRGTAPLLARGVDPAALLKEFMGKPDGLCGGMGGHMHLFAPEFLAASSGIVGASGPAAVGFALANQRLRPGKISVAFFGEGATNEGMMLESFNLASSWKLPVMFVCKDNGQSVVTRTSQVTGGSLIGRAAAFGLRAVEVDGGDVEAVWKVAMEEIYRLRNGERPTFLLASCMHLEGHFLGDQLLRLTRLSITDALKTAMPLGKALFQTKGAPLGERIAGLQELQESASGAVNQQKTTERDPIKTLRNKLIVIDKEHLLLLEKQVANEIDLVFIDIPLTRFQLGGKQA